MSINRNPQRTGSAVFPFSSRTCWTRDPIIIYDILVQVTTDDNTFKLADLWSRIHLEQPPDGSGESVIDVEIHKGPAMGGRGDRCVPG